MNGQTFTNNNFGNGLNGGNVINNNGLNPGQSVMNNNFGNGQPGTFVNNGNNGGNFPPGFLQNMQNFLNNPNNFGGQQFPTQQQSFGNNPAQPNLPPPNNGNVNTQNLPQVKKN